MGKTNMILAVVCALLLLAIAYIHYEPKKTPVAVENITEEIIKEEVDAALKTEVVEIKQESPKTEQKIIQIDPVAKTKILAIGKEKFAIEFDTIIPEKFKIKNGDFTAFGRISEDYIEIDEIDFNKLDLSKFGLDIYDGSNTIIYDFFEINQPYEIKINTVIIKEKRYKNISISYNDKSLKVSSEFLQIYARKKSEISGFIRLSSFPFEIPAFTSYPFSSALRNCNADIIFTSPIKQDFSSLFFASLSDFKFDCTESNLTEFNLKKGIKGIFGMNNISYDETKNVLEKNIFSKSDYKSDISLKGQVNQGKMTITSFTATSLYGDIEFKIQTDFLKRKFDTAGEILLNFVSPELFKIDYQNSGTIYKDFPQINVPSQKMIQKYYLEDNYQRTADLLM